VSVPDKYDVVIVGGRCAGAALGTFLARDGAKVAIIDAGAGHSDAVVSTHLVHPAGMDVLRELGLAETISQEAPAWNEWRFDIEGGVFDIPMPPGREEHAPRRYFLDGVLQDAADEAGAAFSENTRLEDVIIEAGRVRGVICSRASGPFELTADLIVGADGRNSTLAKLVGAEEYLGYDAPRGAYWADWDVPPDWRTERWPFQGYFASRENTIRWFAETNDRQLLIGTAPPVPEIRSWRSRHVESYVADLERDDVIASIVAQSKRASEVRGTIQERYFFRRAAGPGWALVGDAGHHKDFAIGDGITQALRDARNLATAIQRGRDDESLYRYWRERDIEAHTRSSAAPNNRLN
jgi:menaquinone-9 beta-reductase